MYDKIGKPLQCGKIRETCLVFAFTQRFVVSTGALVELQPQSAFHRRVLRAGIRVTAWHLGLAYPNSTG